MYNKEKIENCTNKTTLMMHYLGEGLFINIHMYQLSLSFSLPEAA